MITKMKKYTFLVPASQYEAFLGQLRDAGVVDVTLKAEGIVEDEHLQQSLAQAENIRHIIRQQCPDQMLKEEADILARIQATKAEQQRMAIWGEFDSQKVKDLAEQGQILHFYSCPTKRFDPQWGVAVEDKKGTTYFVTINTALDEELATEYTVGERSANELAHDLEALNGLLAAAQGRKQAWWLANEHSLREELRTLEQSIDWQKVTLSADDAAEGALKLLEGFCPVENVEALNTQLESAQCYYELEDPKEGDATPIKLHNNWFGKLFEPMTGMYGWPNYQEFDPTPILAPFYLLFFSLCVGDFGYGLLVTLFGILVAKGKLKIEMFDGLGSIIAALGVGCTVIGYLMGGFFGMDLFAAEWIPEWMKIPMFKHWIGDGKGFVAGYDVMMVLALVIGIVHLVLAITVKAISHSMRFGWRATLSTWGWLLLIVGSLVGAVLWGTSVLSADSFKVLWIVIAAVSALGILLFNTPGRNPLMNIGGGLWDTYQTVTGLLGDILSYLRLYALGMAGAMLGAAFNSLGQTILGDEPGILAWLFAAIVVTIGHVLNLLMACLGAFVHPLRLTFVEYFKNVGYEGVGKQYSPFSKR